MIEFKIGDTFFEIEAVQEGPMGWWQPIVDGERVEVHTYIDSKTGSELVGAKHGYLSEGAALLMGKLEAQRLYWMGEALKEERLAQKFADRYFSTGNRGTGKLASTFQKRAGKIYERFDLDFEGRVANYDKKNS